MAVITLLRHAPLPLKYQKRYIGHSDISIDLSLTNISKLEEIKSTNYDLIYSSDLKRCRQTLDLIKNDYIIDQRIREVKFKKDFETKSFLEVEKFDSFNSKYLDSMKKWHEYICAESFNDFENRVKDFIDNLPKNKNILICSHAGTLKMIYSLLTNIEYESNTIHFDYCDFLVL